ncbi:hypothetical protein [Zhongshania sp.]|uniref:hypothetical protein n=1 Tax=Zhongshania sp. TaxID=1971902 RepID=UPI0035642203
MTTLKLTENEKNFLKQCINYDDRESQKNDNYCCAGLEEAAAIFGGNLNAGKGLLSSMTQKGIGDMDDEGYDIFWINEDRIDALYDALGLE